MSRSTMLWLDLGIKAEMGDLGSQLQVAISNLGFGAPDEGRAAAHALAEFIGTD